MTRSVPISNSIAMSEAMASAATGDIWLFRGNSKADKAIRLFTNSPVNHVCMVVAIEDLPPLVWHAELGKSLTDVWTGTKHRGAQLHRLDEAVSTWAHTYGQQVWYRPIDIEISRAQEDQILAVINEFSGRAFPRTGNLARRWLLGRIRRQVSLEDLYCAELVATTFERIGLLQPNRPANWYDPGRFWSGDRLQLTGASLGTEVMVTDIAPLPVVSP